MTLHLAAEVKLLSLMICVEQDAQVELEVQEGILLGEWALLVEVHCQEVEQLVHHPGHVLLHHPEVDHQLHVVVLELEYLLGVGDVGQEVGVSHYDSKG